MECKLEQKTVKSTSITLMQQMTHQDANFAGNVHGGVIMKLIDNTAGLVAARHSCGNVVTASIDRLDFYNPVFIGDLLRISASINMVGKTSMEVGVRVESENVLTGVVRHTASAYLTFVALDEKNKPKLIPPIIIETEEEARRNREALIRREMRLAEKVREKEAHKK